MKQDQAFNWDSIPVRVGVTADPAAGADAAAVVVPAGKRWLFYGGVVQLVAAAVAITRTYYMWVTDATSGFLIYISAGGLGITTGQTKQQSWTANSLLTAAGTQYGMHIPLLEMPAGTSITIPLTNIQGADNMTAFTYWYKEAPL
jgi:hypothetical protein